MKCCEDTMVVGEDAAVDPRCEASRALRRLVGFAASALDVRFAFVVAMAPAVEPLRVGLWLARDYGLRSEYAELEGPEGQHAPASLDFASLFRRLWPHEPELAALRPGGGVSVSLVDAQARIVGHLGILDSERSCRVSARERLAPLAKSARAEVERWVGAGG